MGWQLANTKTLDVQPIEELGVEYRLAPQHGFELWWLNRKRWRKLLFMLGLMTTRAKQDNHAAVENSGHRSYMRVLDNPRVAPTVRDVFRGPATPPAKRVVGVE